MTDEYSAHKKRLKNHIVRDGIMGHLVGIQTEGPKLGKIKDSHGQIPGLNAEDVSAGKVPELMKIRLPDSKMPGIFQILKIEIDSRSGFKALAYREVDAATHTPVTIEGKSELFLSFQGRIGGKADNLTTLKALLGKSAANVREVEKFIQEAIDSAGGKDSVSRIICGSHCIGCIDAIEACRVIKKAGMEAEAVLLETWGARSALEHLAIRLEKQWRREYKSSLDQGRTEFKKYGLTDEEADKAIIAGQVHTLSSTAIVQVFFRKIAESITTINAGPLRSSMNRFPGGVGDPAGNVYMLDVSKVEHLDEKGQKKEQTGTDRHRLTTLIQACYDDGVLQYVRNVNAIESGRHGTKVPPMGIITEATDINPEAAGSTQ